MSRRPLAAVVGCGEDSASPDELRDAQVLGRALVDAGFRLVTGGLGGVMEAASRGAHTSDHYRDGDVVGILPGYDAATANPSVDVAICTGAGHVRNVLVVASADVVLAVGGRAGTLSEVALAWTLGKPVVAVGSTGWGARLAGTPVDDRRDDEVHGPCRPEEGATLARSLVASA